MRLLRSGSTAALLGAGFLLLGRGPDQTKAQTPVTFSEHVAPILFANYVVPSPR
jgi:hypothetical protein